MAHKRRLRDRCARFWISTTFFLPENDDGAKRVRGIGLNVSSDIFCGTRQVFLIAISDRIRFLTTLGKAEQGGANDVGEI